LRWCHTTRPAGTIALLGLLGAGAAGNTGIVVAGAAVLCGAVQSLCRCCGHHRGPFVLGARQAAGAGLALLRAALALGLLGVLAAGIVSMRAVALISAGDDTPMGISWCRNSTAPPGGCWLAGGVTDYALGAHAAVLTLAGLVGAVAAMRLVNGLEEVLPMHVLAPFAVVAGALALPAAGNTGLLAGGVCLLFGGVSLFAAGNPPPGWEGKLLLD